jgi:hypothetical protein
MAAEQNLRFHPVRAIEPPDGILSSASIAEIETQVDILPSHPKEPAMKNRYDSVLPPSIRIF